MSCRNLHTQNFHKYKKMEIAYKKIKVEVAFWTRKKMIFPVDAIAACVMLKRSLQLG